MNDTTATDNMGKSTYWQKSASEIDVQYPRIESDIRCEIAVVGGGYTGLSAALHLVRDFNVDVIVLEAEQPGWGASGRNGGFCSMGSSKLSWPQMQKQYGLDAAQAFFQAQRDSVDLVAQLAAQENLTINTTGGGEFQLAHRASRIRDLTEEQTYLRTAFGEKTEILSRQDLQVQGMQANGFHAGLRYFDSFGVHPLDYVRGLARVATSHGARVFGHSALTGWRQQNGYQILQTSCGSVRARSVIIATNGYTPEQHFPALYGRTMPVQSNIIATRVLSQDEINEQGWRTNAICYDSRHLLHYFRLLHDGTFIFGGRGGISDSVHNANTLRKRLTAEFKNMFPAWASVEIQYSWRGRICMTLDRLPHIGHFPNNKNIYFGLAYHGNGVAMATWTGRALAGMVVASSDSQYQIPAVLTRPLPRFPIPMLRSLYFRIAYGYYFIADRC